MRENVEGIQQEAVDDEKQARMNEKINLKLIKNSEEFKKLYDKIENIELRLDALENP